MKHTQELSNEWTKPFHGVTHLNEWGPKNYSATVIDYESFSEVLLYFPGCGFEPRSETYSSVENAKARAESYLTEHKSI